MSLSKQMQILNEVLGLLNEEVLINKIDIPIEKALRLYSITKPGNCTIIEFKQMITALYMHIYNKESEALKESIWILEKYYKGDETTGYDGALYDATKSSSDGVQLVIERFSEIIKTLERSKYITQTLTTLIDPSDWNLRYEITAELLERFNHLYSPELKNLPTIQLVSHLDKLVIDLVTTTQVVNNILN